MNYVKLLVRDAALDLREFTVDQMVKATNCKRASVENEIRHMRHEKYLTTMQSTGPHGRPGKPSSIYRLVDDENKVNELINQVRSFRPNRERPNVRLGQNYQLAHQFLDRAKEAPEEDQGALLSTAENLLRAAWADQGDSGDVTDAFFIHAQGRLLSLRKDYESAGRLLREAAQMFDRHPGYEVQRVEAWQNLFSNLLEQTIQTPKIRPLTLTGPVSVVGKQIIPRAIVLGSRRSSPVLDRLRRAAQAVMRVDVGPGFETSLQESLAHTLETVVESLTPEKQVVHAAWDCLSAQSLVLRPPRHQPWRYHHHRNYCKVKFEKAGKEIRVIRGEPVRYGSRYRDSALREIELAVRGPIHSFRSIPAGMIETEGRKLGS